LTQRASPSFARIVLIDRKPKISLSQRILLTFHDTFETRDIDVAVRRLKILEAMATVSCDVASRERRGLWLPVSGAGTSATALQTAPTRYVNDIQRC